MYRSNNMYRSNYEFCDIACLIGKTITEVTGLEAGSYEITFECSDGSKFSMLHEQDCCEDVSVYDVDGDASALVGALVLSAEEVSSTDAPAPDVDFLESYTWTFYKIETSLGGIWVRWLGESNGWYSERVDFVRHLH